jgi:type IV pilus assembly protein PilM
MALAFGTLGKKLFSRSESSPQGVLGIDLGSSSIKLVQLRTEDGNVTLDTYGELQLGPYAGLGVGRATNLEAPRLAEALSDIITEAGVSSRNAGTAVPYASSFITVIPVPVANTPGALEHIIPIEARKYVPVPISQVTLDWFIVPPHRDTPEGGKGTRILLAAIHNEAMARSRAVLTQAGVANAFDELEIFSSIRSSIDDPASTVMVLDIGAATSKLYIVAEGVVQATHSLPVGGQDMTSSLAQSLELTHEAAEEMKRQVGLTAEDNPRIARAMSFILERIAMDARRMIEAYERTGSSPVTSIVLSGGGSALRGLEEYLERALGRKVTSANPFSKVVYPAFLDATLKEIGPSFSVALGVALRRLSER